MSGGSAQPAPPNTHTHLRRLPEASAVEQGRQIAVLLTTQLQEKSSRNRPPPTSPNSRLLWSGQFGRHHEPSWLRRAFLENDHETGWEGRLGPEKLRQGRSRRGWWGERLNLPAARLRGSLPPSPLLPSPPRPIPANPRWPGPAGGGRGRMEGRGTTEAPKRPRPHCPELGGNGVSRREGRDILSSPHPPSRGGTRRRSGPVTGP